MLVFLPMAFAALVIADSAGAQETRSPTIDDVLACRAETENTKRLACFDRAATALSDAAAKKEIQIVTREDVRRTRRSLFGFALPKLPFFSGDDSGDTVPDIIEAVVKSVRGDGYGRYTIVLTDGAVWRNTEELRFAPTAGDKLQIKAAALGSYMMKVNGGRAVRALRVG